MGEKISSHLLPIFFFVSQNIYEYNSTKVLTLNIKIRTLQSVKIPKWVQI